MIQSIDRIPHVRAAAAYSRQDMNDILEEVMIVNQFGDHHVYSHHINDLA